MLKVQLKKNVRLFDFDDTDFLIQKGEIKELPKKNIRSYSIKHHLFHGLLEIVSGEVLFKLKAGYVFINKETLYAMEYDKFFKKDLFLDTITFIDRDQIPNDILQKIFTFAGMKLDESEKKTTINEEVVKSDEESEEPKVEEPSVNETVEKESKEEFDIADVNKDGKVDFGDVIAVGRKMFKKNKSKKSDK